MVMIILDYYKLELEITLPEVKQQVIQMKSTLKKYKLERKIEDFRFVLEESKKRVFQEHKAVFLGTQIMYIDNFNRYLNRHLKL